MNLKVIVKIEVQDLKCKSINIFVDGEYVNVLLIPKSFLLIFQKDLSVNF